MKKWNIGNLWKKYKYVGLVVLAGILLMLLPGKKTDAQTQESGGSFSLEDTERRMEELLGRMDGVGRVQVMLTLKNGPELELAEDADDTDRDGELRRFFQYICSRPLPYAKLQLGLALPAVGFGLLLHVPAQVLIPHRQV